jgi:fibronectin type 3 domain-containing protein
MKAVVLTVVTLAVLIIAGCGVGPPHAPANLSVTAAAPVTLSWNIVMAASRYNIYRGTDSGSLSSKILLATNVSFNGEYPATTYIDTSTTAGITYYYQVTAVNWDIESAGSNEVSSTP